MDAKDSQDALAAAGVPLANKVTIAIPTYNRAEYLRIALESALAQTYSPLEILVSSNASSDSTMQLLESCNDPRLRVIVQQTTISMMENWNACLSAASGKYFLLLSDDDVLEPTIIAEMVDAFEDSSRRKAAVAFVWSDTTKIDQDGRMIADDDRSVPPLESAKDLLFTFFECRHDLRLCPCATLFRKDDLAPGYDLRFPLAADTAQWMRTVIRYGCARYIDRKLAHYRMHQNTTLATRPDVWCREFAALAEFAIGELRANGYSGWDFERDIRDTEQKRNVRLTIGMIKYSLRDKKVQALSEYLSNYRKFNSRFGLVSLIKGVLIILMPKGLESWLRSRRRSLKVGLGSGPQRA